MCFDVFHPSITFDGSFPPRGAFAALYDNLCKHPPTGDRLGGVPLHILFPGLAGEEDDLSVLSFLPEDIQSNF